MATRSKTPVATRPADVADEPAEQILRRVSDNTAGQLHLLGLYLELRRFVPVSFSEFVARYTAMASSPQMLLYEWSGRVPVDALVASAATFVDLLAEDPELKLDDALAVIFETADDPTAVVPQQEPEIAPEPVAEPVPSMT